MGFSCIPSSRFVVQPSLWAFSCWHAPMTSNWSSFRKPCQLHWCTQSRSLLVLCSGMKELVNQWYKFIGFRFLDSWVRSKTFLYFGCILVESRGMAIWVSHRWEKIDEIELVVNSPYFNPLFLGFNSIFWSKINVKFSKKLAYKFKKKKT